MTFNKAEFDRLEHHINGRIEVVEALNQYLGQNIGFFGLINWWGVYKFVKDQLAINQRLINQRAEMLK